VSASDYPQVVYLWGDDEWTMDRIVASIATRLAQDTGAPPERWRFAGGDVTADALSERLAIAPMFGGGAVVVVANPLPLVRAKAQREALDRVIASVAPGNALVFLEFTSSGSKKRAKALEDLGNSVIAAGGTARPCRAPSPGEMPAWITGRAAEVGVQLAPEANRELARRLGTHIGEGDVDRRLMSAMAVSELEKLALYRGGDPVTAEDVRALVAEVVPDSLWSLTDAVALRRAELAGPALDHALESQPEQVLLVLLHRRIRELLIAADARASGLRPADMVALIGGSPFAVQKRAEQAGSWTVPELDAALAGLLDLDRMLKHAGPDGTTDGQRRMAWAAWVADCVAPRTRSGAERPAVRS
jgi:DNA polymerase III delta subunit